MTFPVLPVTVWVGCELDVALPPVAVSLLPDADGALKPVSKRYSHFPDALKKLPKNLAVLVQEDLSKEEASFLLERFHIM